MAKASHSALDAAEWMRDELMAEGYLDQSSAASEIEERFGSTFTYTNDGGGTGIDKAVLKEFRRLTEGRVVWSRSELAWRKQRTKAGQRLVE